MYRDYCRNFESCVSHPYVGSLRLYLILHCYYDKPECEGMTVVFHPRLEGFDFGNNKVTNRKGPSTPWKFPSSRSHHGWSLLVHRLIMPYSDQES